MACSDISAGRQEVCKDSIGGLQGVYFMNFTTASFEIDVDGTEATNPDYGMITEFPAGSTVYYYELKGTSAYTETVNTSRENGTTFFSQELTLNLKKLTNEMTTQMKLLAYGRPIIFVHTKAGDTLALGLRNGADLTGGTIQTGAGLGDLYGYSLTFTGEEDNNARFLYGSTKNNPFENLVTPPATIVYS